MYKKAKITSLYLFIVFISNNLFSMSAVSTMAESGILDRLEERRRREEARLAHGREVFLKERISKESEILKELTILKALTLKISHQKINDLFIDAIRIFSSKCVIQALDLGANKIKEALNLVQAHNELFFWTSETPKIITDEKELIISELNKAIKRAQISKEYLDKIKILPELNNMIIEYLLYVKDDSSSCVIL